MTPWPIDLDTESIQYEGQWYTRDELARRIRGMLDSGDFSVGKPSQALEQLTITLGTLRTLAFKITPEMAEAVQQAAVRQGRTAGGLIREAISDYLGFAAMPAHAQPQAQAQKQPGDRSPERHGRKPTDPELPAVTISEPAHTAPAVPTVLPEDLKTTQQMAIPPVLAGPGALRSLNVAPPTAAPVPSVVVDGGAIVSEDVSLEEAAGAVSLKPKKQDDEPAERGWFGR